jgi:hypothetical protein
MIYRQLHSARAEKGKYTGTDGLFVLAGEYELNDEFYPSFVNHCPGLILDPERPNQVCYTSNAKVNWAKEFMQGRKDLAKELPKKITINTDGQLMGIEGDDHNLLWEVSENTDIPTVPAVRYTLEQTILEMATQTLENSQPFGFLVGDEIRYTSDVVFPQLFSLLVSEYSWMLKENDINDKEIKLRFLIMLSQKDPYIFELAKKAKFSPHGVTVIKKYFEIE